MSSCFYCIGGPAQDELMIKITDLSFSVLYLFREQTYRGRIIVACKRHVRELFELSEDELIKFSSDIARAAEAATKVFNCTKINYGAYGDTSPHLHFHLTPKYPGGPDFGSVFQMNPRSVYLTDLEYLRMVAAIKESL